MYFFLFSFQVNLVEKMKNAPNDSYQIGFVIGSYLPFVILVGLAYWMYYRAKKADKEE